MLRFMKFEPELMREILMAVESMPLGQPAGGIHSDDFPPDVVGRHTQILVDEGYIEGKYVVGAGGGVPACFALFDITLKGHQFVENARNDTVWKKVVAKAKADGHSVGISVLNGLLEAGARKYADLDN